MLSRHQRQRWIKATKRSAVGLDGSANRIMLTRIAREKASPFEIMVLKEKRIAALREASGDSS